MDSLDFSQIDSFLASVDERDLYVSFNVPANAPDPVRTQIPVSLFLEMAPILEAAQNQEDRNYRVTLIDLGVEAPLLGRHFTTRIVTAELFNLCSTMLSTHLSNALA
jgi:hypothetical protein